jgi:hypothetical protein
MSFRSGGETADHQECTPNNLTIQELAVAGPSAIESLGPEPGGPKVWVEIAAHAAQPFRFALRCGVFAAGGEHE